MAEVQPGAFDLARVYRTEIAAFVVSYAFAEVLWLRFRHGRQHRMPELLSNLFIYVVDTAVRIMTWPARLALFVLIHEASPLRVPTCLPTAMVCYLGVDLILYWYHRVLHETELGWALHSVHHTGRDRDLNINRVHAFYDHPEPGADTRRFWTVLIGYPLVFHLPTHVILSRCDAGVGRSIANGTRMEKANDAGVSRPRSP